MKAKKQLYDKLAGLFIVSGGVAIIIVILAVFAFILLEVLPLFSKPSHGPFVKTVSAPVAAGAIGIGVNEHRKTAYAVFPEGVARFFSLETGKTENEFFFEGAASSFSTLTNAKVFALGGVDGVLRLFTISYKDTYAGGSKERKVVADIKPLAASRVADSALLKTDFILNDSESYSAAAYTKDGRLFFVPAIGSEPEESVFGEDEEFRDAATPVPASEITTDISDEKITGLVLAEEGNVLYVSTASGLIFQWDTSESGSPVFLGSQDATADRSVGVTTMGLLLGDRSIAVGDASGRLSVWFRSSGSAKLMRVHEFESFPGAVSLFSNSLRTRNFAVSDSLGNLGVFHATTSRRRLLIESPEKLSAIVFTPKGDSIAAIAEDGGIAEWEIRNDYSEISIRSIFSRIWYEGYDSPIYMWQSTGGTDEFEPKLGLVPIIFGTFKGAVYSLLFAVPIAVLAALCVSQFMHPSFSGVIKPVIEIMAGLPSVVIGFFAGLWLSPVLERVFSALVIMPFLIIVFSIVCLYLLKLFGGGLRRYFRPGAEYLFLVPAIAGAVAVSLWLNAPAERFLFQGDYNAWLAAVGLDFDQRNALVVGFAMGFAVIPIVFTIAEDSMSGVPKSLIASSLALGASKWQTAIRIVVPSASPGILSAVIIGFGRAIGETMIVLMATGNTPLLDWNIFNGFRAMSANIAVELPEAPQGGGLYRLIFLTSLLLFLFTFFLNTVAEFMRARLSRKYGAS